jgi:hypothetical protein
MGRVLHLFYAPARRLPMKEVEEIRAVENHGFQGCAHARPAGWRQVLLMDRETLDAFGLEPGRVREKRTQRFSHPTGTGAR